jgi:alpha-beta hydrolase superfamily lysophospholipase
MASVEEVQDYIPMTDGFSLFYRGWRKRALVEHVIVAIHGGGGHSDEFRVLGPRLADEGNIVYAVDLRGFGNSQEEGLPRGDTRDFARHLQDLDDMIRHVRKKHPGKRLVVLGYSLGGCYALWYAAHYVDVVDSLVLVAPGIVVRTLSSRRYALLLAFASLLVPRRMFDVAKSSFVKGRDPHRLRQLQQKDPLSTWQLSFSYLAHVKKTLVDPALTHAAHIATPTLVLQGDADRSALPHGARRLHDCLRATDKTLHTVPDADHTFYDIFTAVPSRANPDPARRAQVFAVITDWLKAH